MFSKITSSKGKRGRQPLLERERDAEGSCSEGGGGIAQECNHGFGVEEGLSWLAKLAGGGEEWRKHTCWMGQNRGRQRKDSHLCDCTKEITQFISGPALPFIVWYSVRLKN